MTFGQGLLILSVPMDDLLVHYVRPTMSTVQNCLQEEIQARIYDPGTWSIG